MLDQDGLLAAGIRSGSDRLVPAGLYSLEQLEQKRCLILVGEPGIGKSRALLNEAERLQAASANVMRVDLSSTREEARLQRLLFENSQFSEWTSSNGELYLLLDSLDEARLRVSVVTGIVLDGLRAADRSRLRVRIACRTADRIHSFENRLEALWGEEEFGVLELAPLDRELVLDAASARGLNPEAFLDAVRVRGVGPLAARPLTLKMLLDEALSERGLPDSQIELYDRALLHLAQEPGEQRATDPLIGPEVDARARVAIAERIGAATILSGRARVSQIVTDTPTPDTVTLSELAGGEEIDRSGSLEVPVAVSDATLREVLGSALFSARGGALGWTHHTYGEHLAARYLTRSGVSVVTALSLLGLHADEVRVAPQLRDVAATAGAMSRTLFDELALRDPSVLLRGDLRHADDAQRRTLVEAILDPSLVWEVGTFDPRARRTLGSLAYSGIEQDLRHQILDRDAMPAVRQLACRLIEFCGLSALEPDLLALALDSSVDIYTRVLAARALKDNASDDSLRQLVPLARDPIAEDTDDDLKAAALEAVCPRVVTVAEVFEFLTPRKEHSYFGAYAWFLRSELPLLLDEPSGLQAGLRWIGSLPPREHPTDSFSSLTETVLSQSFGHLGRPGIADALAQAITTHLAHWHSLRELTDSGALDVLRDTDLRQELLTALIRPLHGLRPIYSSLLLINSELAAVDDIPWMLGQLDSAAELEDAAVWVALICQLARNPAADHDAIWDARAHQAVLDEAISWIYDPIQLDSELAETLRDSYAHEQERQSKKEGEDRPEPPSREELVLLLDRFEAGEDIFMHILAALWSDGEHRTLWAATRDFSGSPGWRGADQHVRDRISAAAQAFLDRYEASENWERAGTLYYWQIAGYSALLYFHAHEPDRLDEIDQSRLPQWIDAALAAADAGGREEELDTRTNLMQYLKSTAPTAFVHAVKERVLAEAARGDGHIFVVHRVQSVLDHELCRMLFDVWKTTPLSTHAFGDILQVLLDSDAQPIEEEAVSLLTTELVDADPERAKRLTTALLAARVDDAWEPFRRLWDRHPEWAKDTFFDIAASDRRGSDLRLDLADGQLADLFVWLSSAFPRNTDPDERGGYTVTPRHDIAHYRDHIVTILANRGTPASIAAMDRMAASTGESFPYARIAAEELRRSRAWNPPSPEEVIRLASNPSLRLLQSDEDLQQLLVADALPRIQRKLRDEGQAHQIWDTHSRRPKQETEIAAWIADRLRDDLQTRGIIINREVEIRVAPRGIGERTDIQVDALATRAASVSNQLTVTIEVKGCWHRELMSAMPDQLASQYLSNQHPVGIYLIAWFDGDRWTDDDARRADCGRRDLETTRQELIRQADGLQQTGYLITPVIIDCAW